MLLAEDGEDGCKKGEGNGNGGERDGADADAPLDLRDDRADPKEEGGQDGGEEPGRAGAENKDDSQPSENAMPKPTDEPKAGEGKKDDGQADKKPVSKEFLDAIWSAEQGNRKPEDRTTDDKSSTSSAKGKYQMTDGSLKDIGWKDKQGNWTEEAKKNGVKTDGDFLKNPDAQDKAAQKYFDGKESRLRKGANAFRGKEVDGIVGKFKITDAGLMAAAHRDGEDTVNKYLEHQQKNGWKSDFSNIDSDVAGKLAIKDGSGKIVRTAEDRFRAVETRLRNFERISYR